MSVGSEKESSRRGESKRIYSYQHTNNFLHPKPATTKIVTKKQKRRHMKFNDKPEIGSYNRRRQRRLRRQHLLVPHWTMNANRKQKKKLFKKHAVSLRNKKREKEVNRQIAGKYKGKYIGKINLSSFLCQPASQPNS